MALYALRYALMHQGYITFHTLTVTTDKEKAFKVAEHHNGGLKVVIGNDGKPLPELLVQHMVEIDDLKTITLEEMMQQATNINKEQQ